MNDLLRYAFEDVRRRQHCDAFVGATEVATELSDVVGLRKAASGGKLHCAPGFLRVGRESSPQCLIF